jgi:CrcB protein
MIMGFGAAGVLARYEIQVLAAKHLPEQTHMATFMTNISGSFLMGAAYVWSLEKAFISDEMRVALLVGFLGGFTTFSSYALESLRLMEAGNMLRTFFYVALSPALAIIFCFLGTVFARKFG